MIELHPAAFGGLIFALGLLIGLIIGVLGAASVQNSIDKEKAG